MEMVDFLGLKSCKQAENTVRVLDKNLQDSDYHLKIKQYINYDKSGITGLNETYNIENSINEMVKLLDSLPEVNYEIKDLVKKEKLTEDEKDRLVLLMDTLIVKNQNIKLFTAAINLVNLAISEGIRKEIIKLTPDFDMSVLGKALISAVDYTDKYVTDQISSAATGLIYICIVLLTLKKSITEIKNYINNYVLSMENSMQKFIYREFECQSRAMYIIEKERKEVSSMKPDDVLKKGNDRYYKEKLRNEYCIELFNEAIKTQIETKATLVNDCIRRYERLVVYCDSEFEEYSVSVNENSYRHNSGFSELPYYSSELNLNIFAGGTILGAGSAAATMGLVTLFGKASTGTAIASLHGSAYVGTLLSALGGGPVAMGGAGILGGVATLAGVFTLPLLAYSTDKIGKEKIKKFEECYINYVEATKESERIRKSTSELAQITKAIEIVNFEMKNLIFFMNGLLDIVECNIVEKGSEDLGDMGKHIESIMDSILNINYFDNDGNFRKEVFKELDEMHNTIGNLHRFYGEYLSSCEKEWQLEMKEKVDIAQKNQMQSMVKPLENAQIRKYFIDSFSNSKSYVYILSPWMNYWVIKDNKIRVNGKKYNLMELIESALKRNVKVKIRYGMKNSKNASESSKEKEKNSDKLASEMRKQFAPYGKLFSIKKTHSHGKLLICDDEYYIMGSFNFLSFDGNYNKKGVRHELADLSKNKAMINVYKNKYFNF